MFHLPVYDIPTGRCGACAAGQCWACSVSSWVWHTVMDQRRGCSHQSVGLVVQDWHVVYPGLVSVVRVGAYDVHVCHNLAVAFLQDPAVDVELQAMVGDGAVFHVGKRRLHEAVEVLLACGHPAASFPVHHDQRVVVLPQHQVDASRHVDHVGANLPLCSVHRRVVQPVQELE